MIRFVLDGAEVTETSASPSVTLLQWLRARRQTGTKEGCAEGDCGACTVAILDPEAPGGPAWRAVNSCLVLLPMVHGCHVVTVAGLAEGPTPHPVQAAMVQALGSQCGFCTPGFVMSLFEGCYRADLDARWKRDDQICGNLCRCTGYRPIRDALDQVAGLRPDDRFREALASPPPPPEPVRYEARGQRFLAPGTLAEALDLLGEHPDARLVCGATDLGLDVTQRHVRHPVLVSLERVSELAGITEQGGVVTIGATTRLTDLEDWSASGLPVLHRMLRYFGARQIKHRATIGGNLCNASPIGDIAPVLLALDAVAVIAGPSGTREVPMAEFFLAYRKTALEPGELLAAVRVRPPAPDERVGAYKVSRRRELDISAVSAAMWVRLDGETVSGARLAYGGMAATPARAEATEAALLGRPWTLQTVQAAAEELATDFSPLDDHRGSAWFRATLARNLLVGFFEETAHEPFVALPERHVGTVVVGEGT